MTEQQFRQPYRVYLRDSRGEVSTFRYYTFREAEILARELGLPIYFRDGDGRLHLCTRLPDEPEKK